MKNHSHRDRGPENSNQPDQAVDAGRRGALARMLAGGAAAGAAAASLPAAWTQPVVQSVLLPAHAQTSGEDTEPEPEEVPEDGNFAFPDTLAQGGGLLNWLISTARAQTTCVIAGCAALENGVVTIWVADSCACCFSGSGNIGDSIGVTTSDSGCASCPIPTIEVVELTGPSDNRVLTILIGSEQVELSETGDTCSCTALVVR